MNYLRRDAKVFTAKRNSGLTPGYAILGPGVVSYT
jgi:hypothetical protein